MIRTKNIDVKDIPETWIFENYCNLTEKLHGQDIKMHSLFSTENTPSMFIYFKDNKYTFKDFSSGNIGDGIDLVQKLFNLNYSKASKKIIDDYGKRNTEEPYEQLKLKPESKFKITSYLKRTWNVLDQKYWTQFGIGSECLEYYKVFPLESYKMSKDADGEILDIDIKGQHIYGYFKNNGTLVKIYRPKNKSLKFINVTRFIHGSDQLTYKVPNLVICSSLKDAMALYGMGFKHIEFVVPNSENSMISKANLIAYSLKYQKIRVFFDNDKAGHSAMLKYESQYGIPGIYLNLSKDIADSVKEYGSKVTKKVLTQLLPNL